HLSHEFAVRYGEAVAPTVRFDTCANEQITAGDVNLGDYSAVLWLLGEESTADESFSSAEQADVSAYLAAGGSLFVSGAEIGWDLDAQGSAADRAFYNNALKADYAADDAGTEQFVPAGGIFADLPYPVGDFHPTWMIVGYPDVLTPLGGATANLTYIADNGTPAGTAGIQYDGAYRLVNLGFPLETVAHLATRRALMNRILGFLLDVDLPDDLIVEARDLAGTQSAPPTLAESGAWADSSAKSAADELSGTGSRFITYDLPNAGTDFATITPNIPVAGRYELFVTWGLGANCYDAQYTIDHADGTDIVLADQIPLGTAGENTHAWVSLGEYRFAPGEHPASGTVEISEASVSGRPSPTWNQRVYFDALKLVLRERDPLGPGDFDGDGDIDGADTAYFTDCLSGPETPFAPGCSPCDTDADGDVDLADFAAFAISFPAP
ncbi:MAG TPA: hypothetical protein P5572_14080, partial [Phycisphaerae bacterium]|nr:hypothetical protein [Phycisphaerae bacterium]